MGFIKNIATQTKHQVTGYQQWHEVDGDTGLEYYPAHKFTRLEALKAYPDVHIRDVKLIEGYGGRLAPSDYLEPTTWNVFPTRQQAEDYLNNTFGPEEAQS